MFEKFPKPLKKEFRYIRSKLDGGSEVKSENISLYELATIYNKLRIAGVRFSFTRNNFGLVINLDIEKDGVLIQQMIIDGTEPALNPNSSFQLLADKNVEVKIGEDIDISLLEENEYYSIIYSEQNHSSKYYLGGELNTLPKGFVLAKTLNDKPTLTLAKVTVTAGLSPKEYNIRLVNNTNEYFKYLLRSTNYESRFVDFSDFDARDTNSDTTILMAYHIDLRESTRGVDIIITNEAGTSLGTNSLNAGTDYISANRADRFPVANGDNITVTLNYRQ